jgi:hypothetical protein
MAGSELWIDSLANGRIVSEKYSWCPTGSVNSFVMACSGGPDLNVMNKRAPDIVEVKRLSSANSGGSKMTQGFT